jgi:octaprenyl-diphosphate synthase
MADFSIHNKSDEIEIEKKLREFLAGSDPIVIQYMESIANQHGKRLRPKLVMVFARLFGDYDYKNSVAAACLSELFHTATLIHDDVIDSAEFRRGEETLSKRFGNEIAVIVGDYLLAVVFERVAKMRDFTLLDMFVGTSKKLGIGVIVEINNRNNFELFTDRYLKVIELKTGVLFELCCRMGAYLGGADEREQAVAGAYGREFGIAFQIVDDLLDIAADPAKTGKPVFNDLKEGRITLPIIYALSRDASVHELLTEWQRSPNEVATEALRARLFELGSVDHSMSVAEEHLSAARAEFAKLEGRIKPGPAIDDLKLIEGRMFELLKERG